MVALGHGEDRKDLEDTYLHSKKWGLEKSSHFFLTNKK
jgi:hypothetical protein